MDLLASLQTTDDPFPLLAWLRENEPLHRTPDGTYYLSRYTDVRSVLNLSGTSFLGPGKQSGEMPRCMRLLSSSMALLNPPEHTRQRGLVSRVFTARRVNDLQPRIEQITDRLLDAVEEPLRDGEIVDLHGALSMTMPLNVTAEMLGVPEADRGVVAESVRAIVLAVAHASPTADQLRDGDEATAKLEEYFVGLFEQRRREPRDDLISALLARHDEDFLDEEELLTMVWGIWVGGFETTAAVIDHGILSNMDNSSERHWLRTDPTRFAEEVLRHQSVVLFTAVGRTAQHDVELSGGTMPEGSAVRLMPAAANRDPEAFTDPDRFDPGRDGPPMLALGHGIHHCLGAHLARTEIAVALAKLHARFPDLERAGEPKRRPSPALRMLDRLPVQHRR